MTKQFKKREIPWANVIEFHKEIARRAEESFFTLPISNPPSENWSIVDFDPKDFGGDWLLNEQSLLNESLKNIIPNGASIEAFIGGPCWFKSKQDEHNNWIHDCCPFLYRSIRFKHQEDGSIEIIPDQGVWDVSPIVLRELERREALPVNDLKELVPKFLESAAEDSKNTGTMLAVCLKNILSMQLPGFEELFNRMIQIDRNRRNPPNWVIFITPSTGGIFNQHLMHDYNRLSEIFQNNDCQIGGLQCFEGFSSESCNDGIINPEPIIALNESQKEAVKGILESKPITVIKGPPGCGKSQVVLSLILNAWQQGISVLFASNNNQAVEVVRRRLEHFETAYPLAIRAGNFRTNNINQVLLDTINNIPKNNENTRSDFKQKLEDFNSKRKELLEKRKVVGDFLSSNLPQSIHEGFRSALKAYADYQETINQLNAEKKILIDEFNSFKIEIEPNSFSNEIVTPIDTWLNRINFFEKRIDIDDDHRVKLIKKKEAASDERNNAALRVGLIQDNNQSWNWIIDSKGMELIKDWRTRFLDFINLPIEEDLSIFVWKKEYEFWPDEISARNWSSLAEGLISDIHNKINQLLPNINLINSIKSKHNEQFETIILLGISPDMEIDITILNQWKLNFSIIISLPDSFINQLPFSTYQSAKRKLRKAESKLREVIISPMFWRNAGVLDDAGRRRLSDMLDKFDSWVSLRAEWINTKSTREAIDLKVNNLQRQFNELLPNESREPTSEPDIWRNSIEKLKDKVLVAKEAAIGWRNSTKNNRTRNKLHVFTNEFLSIEPGVPIKESWNIGKGTKLNKILQKLSNDPTSDDVQSARAELHTNCLYELIDSWEKARESEKSIRKLQNEINDIPSKKKRFDEWVSEWPIASYVLSGFHPTDEEFPDSNHHLIIENVIHHNWISEWDKFCKTTEPNYRDNSKIEFNRACENINRALELLPEGKDRVLNQNTINKIKDDSIKWDTEAIQKIFEIYNPNKIKNKLIHYDFRIEHLSLEIAKNNWASRVMEDPEISDQINNLQHFYHNNGLSITNIGNDSFVKSLKGIPIWITTAMSTQSIPLLPNLFDILVIDEATQCTFTNTLPLIYRAKRLVVIGDKDQLPAIPNINVVTETALAVKYGISDQSILTIVGHADTNLYEAAVQSIPGRQTSVIALTEHYRSQPLIIGFSNQNIYQTKLKIRTAKKSGSDLPYGSSIHGKHVNGVCERGEYQKSWRNRPESDSVCELVNELKLNPTTRNLSIGIVTPFTAQQKLIQYTLNDDNITVGTAHTFQGDERDIMIFSPVVANGVSEGSIKWVAEPYNLINVAITRAKLALFVVADFEFCREQNGILGKLIKYVEKVELLRKTSYGELELFSMMIIEGWNPEVHLRKRDLETDFVMNYNGIRLAIEVDGREHHKGTKEADDARDTFLRAQGYEVLRIPARAISETPIDVINQIRQKAGFQE